MPGIGGPVGPQPGGGFIIGEPTDNVYQIAGSYGDVVFNQSGTGEYLPAFFAGDPANGSLYPTANFDDPFKVSAVGG